MTPFVTDSGLVFSDPTPRWLRLRGARRRTERVLRTKTVGRVSERLEFYDLVAMENGDVCVALNHGYEIDGLSVVTLAPIGNFFTARDLAQQLRRVARLARQTSEDTECSTIVARHQLSIPHSETVGRVFLEVHTDHTDGECVVVRYYENAREYESERGCMGPVYNGPTPWDVGRKMSRGGALRIFNRARDYEIRRAANA